MLLFGVSFFLSHRTPTSHRHRFSLHPSPLHCLHHHVNVLVFFLFSRHQHPPDTASPYYVLVFLSPTLPTAGIPLHPSSLPCLHRRITVLPLGVFFFFSRLHQQSIGPTSHASVTIITSLSGLDHDIFLVFLFFPSRHQHSPRCCITMLSLGVSFPWPTLSLPHHLQSILCIHRLVHITGSLHFVLSPWCFFFLESITPLPLYYALHPFD